jgi:hypothetical protein
MQAFSMSDVAAGAMGPSSHAAGGVVSVQTDRVSDRDSSVPARGVSQHHGTRMMDSSVATEAEDSMVGITATSGSVPSGGSGGGGGRVHAGPMAVADLRQVGRLNNAASAGNLAGGDQQQRSSSQTSPSDRDSLTAATNSANNSLTTDHAHESVSLVIPAHSSSSDDRKVDAAPSSAAKPRGRAVFDHKLARTIPRFADMNAESIIVEFMLKRDRFVNVGLYYTDLSLGREFMRVFLGLTSLNTTVNPSQKTVTAVVNAVKTTERIRLIGPSRDEIRQLKEQLKELKNNPALASGPPVPIKMAWTFKSVEDAQAATAALGSHLNVAGDRCFAVSSGTAAVICGVVSGIPRTWSDDDIMGFMEHNLRGKPEAAVVDEMSFQRIVNGLAVVTGSCNFAMSPRALKVVQTMSTEQPYGGAPLRLVWQRKERDPLTLCSQCLGTDHTKRSCKAPLRCYVCGHSGHSRGQCNATAPLPCFICRTNPHLAPTGAKAEHLTYQCPHLRVNLVTVARSGGKPAQSRPPPSADREHYPSLPSVSRHRSDTMTASSYAARAAASVTQSAAIPPPAPAMPADIMNLLAAQIGELGRQLKEAVQSTIDSRLSVFESKLSARTAEMSARMAAHDSRISAIEGHITSAMSNIQELAVAAAESRIKTALDNFYSKLVAEGVIPQQQRPSGAAAAVAAPASASVMRPPAPKAKRQQKQQRQSLAITTTNAFAPLAAASPTRQSRRTPTPSERGSSPSTPSTGRPAVTNTAKRRIHEIDDDDDSNGDGDRDSDEEYQPSAGSATQSTPRARPPRKAAAVTPGNQNE